MNYELALKLKEAGFTQPAWPDRYTYQYQEWYAGEDDGCGVYNTIETITQAEDSIYKPTLSELIESCGDNICIRLQSYWNENELAWQADTCGNFKQYDHGVDKTEIGSTPEIAVANLYLALKKNG